MNQNISQKTNVIKTELNSWKNDILNILKDYIFKNEVFFLVNNHWLNDYEKCISNFDDQELKIRKYDDGFKLNNYTNNKVLDSLKFDIPIEKLPKVFFLNKSAWDVIHNINKELNSISSIGYCANNLMTLKVCNNIYCFFFLDKKSQIRQGYLEIIKLENENKILNDFQSKGIFKFINKDINDINNDFLLIEEKEYKLFITENNETEEKMKNIFNKKLKLFAKGKKKLEKMISEAESRKIFKEKMEKFKKMPKVVKTMKQINSLSKKDENEKEKDIDNMNVKLRARRNFSAKKIEKVEKQKKFNKKYEYLDLKDFFPKKLDNNNKLSLPGLIGLNNIGATCYMNATLQCFSNIPQLRQNLLNKKTYKDLENNKNTKKLSFALAEVLKNLWEVLSQRQYSPTNFKNTISEMNPLFKGIAANDPKDLVLFLLQTIHKELNEPQNNLVENNNLLNNTNFADVFEDFVKYDTNKNNSIISKEFNGYINSMTMCAFCGTIIHNIQSYNILFFPLEEVRKFMNYNHKTVMIKDCFRYNEKQDSYPSFYCNKCRGLCLNYNSSKLICTPKTLIINLNRGRGLEYDVNIIFDEYLNLKEFIYSSESPYYYELTGVISHFGSNDQGGHFIAYCKNNSNCEWYKYNDSVVNKCTFDEVIRTGLPYVLFYNYVKT